MPVLIVSQNGQKALFTTFKGIECLSCILAVWVVVNSYAGGCTHFDKVLESVYSPDCYGSA
jgi:hypothetical protein